MTGAEGQTCDFCKKACLTRSLSDSLLVVSLIPLWVFFPDREVVKECQEHKRCNEARPDPGHGSQRAGSRNTKGAYPRSRDYGWGILSATV